MVELFLADEEDQGNHRSGKSFRNARLGRGVDEVGRPRTGSEEVLQGSLQSLGTVLVLEIISHLQMPHVSIAPTLLSPGRSAACLEVIPSSVLQSSHLTLVIICQFCVFLGVFSHRQTESSEHQG